MYHNLKKKRLSVQEETGLHKNSKNKEPFFNQITVLEKTSGPNLRYLNIPDTFKGIGESKRGFVLSASQDFSAESATKMNNSFFRTMEDSNIEASTK